MARIYQRPPYEPRALGWTSVRVARYSTRDAGNQTRRRDYGSSGSAADRGPIVPSAVSYSAIVIATSMRLPAICRRIIATDTGVLVLSALALVALHTATNGEYGFHRDELATIDDARFLSWGYVVYPPVTPFIARVSLTLFGASMIGRASSPPWQWESPWC